MNGRSLRASGAIVAAAALLLTMVLVPAASAGPIGATKISFSVAKASVYEGDTATIYLRRTNSAGPATVTVSVVRGTATAGTDYSAENLNAQVAFAAGSDTVGVDVPILVDGVADEANETVKLGLSNPSGTSRLGSPRAMTLTILEMPPPPAPVLATPTAANPVVLNWTEGPYDYGTVTFTISRCTDPLTSPFRLCLLDITGGGISSTTFTDSGVTAGSTYYYRVVAENTDGAGSPSNEVSVTVPDSAPQWITGITATPMTTPNNHIYVDWTASSDAPPDVHYLVYRGTIPTSLILEAEIYLASITYFKDSYATSGTTYYYQVVARSGGVDSPSEIVSATAP